MNEAKKAVELLKKRAHPNAKSAMERFGIPTENALGVYVPDIRAVAKQIGKNHALALELFEQPVHEAKLLAVFVAEPEKVTSKSMDAWTKKFYSWDICDACCGNVFDRTPFAFEKALEYSKKKEEFVKRTGFALMATSAVHNKKALDAYFEPFFARIKQESVDDRNFVRKAVNWSLRQIGKRNGALNKKAISIAKEIAQLDSKTAKWIAADALRELKSQAVQKRLKTKK